MSETFIFRNGHVFVTWEHFSKKFFYDPCFRWNLFNSYLTFTFSISRSNVTWLQKEIFVFSRIFWFSNFYVTCIILLLLFYCTIHYWNCYCARSACSKLFMETDFINISFVRNIGKKLLSHMDTWYFLQKENTFYILEFFMVFILLLYTTYLYYYYATDFINLFSERY